MLDVLEPSAGSEALGALARLVPRIGIEWVQREPDVRHRRFPASLVFVDISGFTALSERLASHGREGAEEITSILQDVFEPLLDVASRNDGSLIKFGGDALFLLFRSEGHQVRAARAADGMRRRLAQVGLVDSLAGRVRLGMTVGAHTGEVDGFLVGGSHRELVVGGPTASRVVELEESAVDGQVVVSPELAAHLDPAWVGPPAGRGLLLQAVADGGDRDVVVEPTSDEGSDLLVPTAIRRYVGAGGRAAEHRHAVVAFVAFSGLDDLVTGPGVAAAADALEELVGIVTEAADEHGVTVVGSDVAPGGGKLVLVGGAPVGHDDDAERVLRAARRIVGRAPRLPLRVGVHAGPLFAGLVGPAHRHTWTVMGDTVNLAARLAHRADVGSVLATDTTLARTRSRFAAVAVEPFEVKGKSAPVRASHVGEPLGARRGEVPQLPLVGREAELAVLDLALVATPARGAVVEVAGPAGIGKTRLLQAFRDAHPDRRVVWGAATAYESTTPYFLFRDLFRFLLGVEAGDDPQLVARRVAELVPGAAAWAPLVARIVDVELPPTPEVAALDPRFVGARLREVAGEVLLALVPAGTILRLEDVHWVDQASSDLLEHLVREVVPDAGWLLLLTTRTARLRDLADHVLDLAPLGEEAVRRLADVAAERGMVSMDVARALARRAGGHPLFLHELLAFAGDGPDDELPDTVERLIGARIDQLEPGHRDLLRHAALLGTTFDLDLLRSVTGRAVAPDDLDVLEAFVRRRAEDTWEFEHSLYREVAYAALPFRTRRELHERTGRVIEARHRGRTGEVAELLALHYHRARWHERAWRHNRVAARKARAAHANAEAVRFLQWALESGTRARVATVEDRVAIWSEMAELYEELGAFDKAEEVLRRARRVAGAEQRPRLWLRSGILRERRGRYRQALGWYSRAAAALEDGVHDPALAVRVAQRRAEVRLMQGRAEEVLGDLEHLLGHCLELGDPALLAQAHHDLAWGLPHGQRADRHADEARRLYAELGRTRDVARLETIVGMRSWEVGDLSAAARHFRASERHFTQAGDPVGAANARMNAAWPLLAQARYDEMVALLEPARPTLQAAGFPIGVAQVDGLLGFAAAARGDLAVGAAVVRDARDRLVAAEVPQAAVDLEVWLCEVALWAGDLASAREGAERLLGEDPLARPGLLGAARVAGLARGPDGVGLLERGLQAAREAGQPLEAALFAAALAHLLESTDPTRSAALLARAREDFARLGAVVDPLRRLLGPDRS